MSGAATSAGIAERLLKFDTAQLSDVLEDLGIEDGVCAGITPLPGSRAIAGPAFIVDLRPHAEVPQPVPEYMSHVAPGSVILMANHGRSDCASWGAMRSAGARQRGAAGTVVDGFYRDVDDHRAQDYPVYGRGSMPRNYRHYTTLAAFQQPVDFAGCRVEPGDWVVGDATGVVIIPAARVEDVIAAAADLAEKERRTMAALDAGHDFEAAKVVAAEGG